MGYGPYESLVLKMQYMHPRSLDQDEEDSLKHLACFAQTFDNSDHMQKGEIKQRANIILANTETIPFELSGPIVSFMTDDRTGRQKAMEVLRSIFRNELFNWNLLDDKC